MEPNGDLRAAHSVGHSGRHQAAASGWRAPPAGVPGINKVTVTRAADGGVPDAIAVVLRRTGRVERGNGSLNRAGPKAEVDVAPMRSRSGRVFEQSLRCRRSNRFAAAQLDHLLCVASIPPRLTRAEPSATIVARLVPISRARLNRGTPLPLPR
jgi:hypothetical protein